MDVSNEIMEYWQRFQKRSGITEAFVGAWSFGDNSQLADGLLELVLADKKTGTATLAIELEKKGEKMPKQKQIYRVLRSPSQEFTFQGLGRA